MLIFITGLYSVWIIYGFTIWTSDSNNCRHHKGTWFWNFIMGWELIFGVLFILAFTILLLGAYWIIKFMDQALFSRDNNN
jgi:hypothetical protein